MDGEVSGFKFICAVGGASRAEAPFSFWAKCVAGKAANHNSALFKRALTDLCRTVVWDVGRKDTEDNDPGYMSIQAVRFLAVVRLFFGRDDGRRAVNVAECVP